MRQTTFASKVRFPSVLFRLTTLVLLFCASLQSTWGQSTVHVFVALCDNENQGIVKVPAQLGNGQDPKNNLYWGAAYGIKSFLRYKDADWTYIGTKPTTNPKILERVLFKHKTKDVYLLADAYDGKHIKATTVDFLKAANGQEAQSLTHEGKTLQFGGKSDVVTYIGHDGLMDFSVTWEAKPVTDPPDAIILACYSKVFFKDHLKKAGANPLLWTTHLMAPEAYTLTAALKGWIADEKPEAIEERAAQAYNKYQKCGITGARNLFTTGY